MAVAPLPAPRLARPCEASAGRIPPGTSPGFVTQDEGELDPAQARLCHRGIARNHEWIRLHRELVPTIIRGRPRSGPEPEVPGVLDQRGWLCVVERSIMEEASLGPAPKILGSFEDLDLVGNPLGLDMEPAEVIGPLDP